MKIIFLAITLAVSTSSFAGLPEMMKVYNNPKLAPKVKACKGDIYCNGFLALAKQWESIPNSYRYQGEYEIKSYAKRGWTYDGQGRNRGLEMGFGLYKEKSHKFLEGVNIYTETKGYIPDDYEGGWAVLLYIEDKKGWAKD